VLEGNFRSGEHEAPLREALGRADLAQVLCRVPEAERLARLAARGHDPSRHPGHRFGERLSVRASQPSIATTAATNCDVFLDLPSARFVHDGTSHRTVLGELDNWMNLRAASL
jgi:hypothetical protein